MSAQPLFTSETTTTTTTTLKPNCYEVEYQIQNDEFRMVDHTRTIQDLGELASHRYKCLISVQRMYVERFDMVSPDEIECAIAVHKKGSIKADAVREVEKAKEALRRAEEKLKGA